MMKRKELEEKALNPLAVSLSQPEHLHFTNGDGSVSYGCDQEWYRTPWQRMAGCGPTTAAALLLYLHRAHGYPLPRDVNGRDDCVALMEAVWRRVTPGFMGVHRIEQLRDGVLELAHTQGAPLQAHLLPVAKEERQRPDAVAVAAFLADGLRADCPVAFLNLSNGKLDNLDEWHWVTLVSVDAGEDGGLWADMYDAGKQTQLDLSLWLQTTRGGGGFVYFTLPDAAEDSQK
jgi:hypothetical protein